MADEIKRIIRIEIDQATIINSRKRAIELAESIAKLKVEQKLNRQETDAQKKAFVENEAKLKALNKEYRQHSNTLTQANILANSAEGSNKKLRAQLSILTDQYNSLSKEERENSDVGQRLAETTKDISDELKRNEKVIGDTRRNVGNYDEAIQNAIDNGGRLNFVLRDMQQELARMAAAGKGGTAEFNNLAKQAGQLQDQIKDAQQATKDFAAGSKFGQIGSTFRSVGQDLKELDFDGAREKAARLAQIAKTLTFSEMITGAKTLGSTFLSLGKALLTNPIFLIATAAAGVAYAISKVIERNKELEATQVALNKTLAEGKKRIDNLADRYLEYQIQLGLLNSTLTEQDAERLRLEKETNKERVELQEQHVKEIRDLAEGLGIDLSKLDDKRVKEGAETYAQYNSLFKKLLDQQSKESIALEQNRVAALLVVDQTFAKERSDQEKQDAKERGEDYKTETKELLAKQKERHEKMEAEGDKFAQAHAEQMRQEAALREELESKLRSEFDQRKLDLDEEVENYRKAGAAKADIDKFYLEQSKEIRVAEKEFALSQTEERINKEVELAKNQTIAQISDAELRNAALADIERNRLAALAQLYDPALNGATAGAEATIILDEETKALLLEKNAAYLAQLAEQDRKTQEQIRVEEEKTQTLKDQALKGTLGVATSVFGALSALAEEGSEDAKALAIAGGLIATFQAAIEAYKSTVGIPIVGPVLAPIAAGAATAFGFANISKIRATKAARGTYLKDGPGTTTSDSIPAMLSVGETVINARSSEAWLPILSAINEWGGGVRFADGGQAGGTLVNRFAGGGVAEIANQAFENQLNTQQVTDSIKEFMPVLVLEEFEAVSGRKVRTAQRSEI